MLLSNPTGTLLLSTSDLFVVQLEPSLYDLQPPVLPDRPPGVQKVVAIHPPLIASFPEFFLMCNIIVCILLLAHLFLPFFLLGLHISNQRA